MKLQCVKIKNWDRWQSYRSDRGQPPWIKIHRRLMRNVEWVSLSDSERGQLVAMWLLAADHDGVIPASPEIIQKLCFMSDIPDINKFTDLGFIENGWRQLDVTMASQRRQHVTPEAEENKEVKKDSYQSPCETSVSRCPQNQIIDLYHKILPELPPMTEWTTTDARNLRNRWKSDIKYQSLEWWEKYFGYIRECPWLMGENPNNWVASLNWIVRLKNWANIARRQYERKHRKTASQIIAEEESHRGNY